MVIGIDPHKRQHTAAALERLTQQQVDSIAIEASVAGYRRLLAWAQRWPERTWAVENARGLGQHLAQWLLARGETVVDVPATLGARARLLGTSSARRATWPMPARLPPPLSITGGCAQLLSRTRQCSCGC